MTNSISGADIEAVGQKVSTGAAAYSAVASPALRWRAVQIGHLNRRRRRKGLESTGTIYQLSTVDTQRKEMERIAEIPQSSRQTSDGRIYPAQRKQTAIYTPTPCAVIDAETRIGELTRALPKASGGDHGNQYTSAKNDTAVDFGKTKSEAIADLGFSPKQVERFEKLATHPEAVEQGFY